MQRYSKLCIVLQNIALIFHFERKKSLDVQGEIFIVPHLLIHGASVFVVSSEEPPQVAASNNRQSGFRTYSIPNPDRTLHIVTHLMHEFL